LQGQNIDLIRNRVRTGGLLSFERSEDDTLLCSMYNTDKQFCNDLRITPNQSTTKAPRLETEEQKAENGTENDEENNKTLQKSKDGFTNYYCASTLSDFLCGIKGYDSVSLYYGVETNSVVHNPLIKLHYQIPTIASNSSEVTLHLANFIFDENE
jgi:hypothetical protein